MNIKVKIQSYKTSLDLYIYLCKLHYPTFFNHSKLKSRQLIKALSPIPPYHQEIHENVILWLIGE